MDCSTSRYASFTRHTPLITDIDTLIGSAPPFPLLTSETPRRHLCKVTPCCDIFKNPCFSLFHFTLGSTGVSKNFSSFSSRRLNIDGTAKLRWRAFRALLFWHLHWPNGLVFFFFLFAFQPPANAIGSGLAPIYFFLFFPLGLAHLLSHHISFSLRSHSPRCARARNGALVLDTPECRSIHCTTCLGSAPATSYGLRREEESCAQPLQAL